MRQLTIRMSTVRGQKKTTGFREHRNEMLVLELYVRDRLQLFHD